MSNVFRRILKGSGANAMTLTAKSFEQLFLIPILLSAWSVELYGEWLLITAIPVYFAMSDLGFVQAGSNELARRASQESEENVTRFFREFTAAFTGWSLMLFALFCAAALLMPLNEWLGLSIMTSSEASAVFLALVLVALVSTNNDALLAGLRVRRLFHVGLLIRAIGAYARIILTFILVFFLDGAPVEVALLNLILRIVEYGTCQILLHRLHLPPSFAIFARRQNRLMPYLLIGLEMMLMPAAYALSLQGTTILVGTIVGTVAVAAFNTHRTLARMATTVLNMFVRPLRAEAGLLQRPEDVPALAALLNRLSRITFWLSICLAVPLILFGETFFTYWTHGSIPFTETIFALLLMASVIEGIWNIAGSIRLGSNRHRPIVWGFLILSVLGLGLSALLGHLAGTIGIAFSLVLVNLAMCMFTIIVTSSLLDQSVGAYLANLVKPPISEVTGIARMIRRRLRR